MTSPTHELQVALVARLKGDTVVSSLVEGRVLDNVPANTPTPYISLGPTDEVSDDADCIDGYEVTVQIDAWSDDVGFPEVRRIADAVRRALRADLQLPVNALVSFEHRSTRTFRDPNGKTSHAAMTFTAFIEER